MKKEDIPKQVKGKHLDISEFKVYGSEQQAERVFEHIRKQLLDINRWHEIAGAASAQFVHVDKTGATIKKLPREGDYIKIDIPGPGSISGEGYDWVRVTELSDHLDEGFLQLTVRPCAPPMTEVGAEAAHFFRDDASSTFVAKRTGTEVRVSYYGRNEEVNLENERLIDNVRNGLVGLGAKLGFSYPQWKALVHGLLEEKEGQENGHR